MKRLRFAVVALCLCVGAAGGRGATVTGNMLDIFGNAAGTSVRFVPSGPLAIGTNTYLDYPRSARITNGLFSVWLAGGFYDADFVPYTLKPIRVLVWPSDTNTYTFNHVATLAVNAAMFNGSNLTVNAYVTTNVWTVYATNIAESSLSSNVWWQATNQAAVVTNSLPFFTVSAAGIANGLSAVTNAGYMYGPDTPGTVTSGLQEALDAIPRATNQGPLAWGGRIILTPGHFYFTNTLLFSNVWNNGLTLEGAGLFQTKLVYAGSGEGVKTVNLCGTPAALASTYPLAGHYNIRDIGFTALNNTTNILLWITNHAYVNIENCQFTSWQIMDNQLHGSGISVTEAQTNASGLVGLHLGANGDHASFIRNCFFNGLATGADLQCDHPIVDGFKTAEIGMNTMLWSNSSPYSLGAAILRRGGMDGHYANVHFYGCKGGLVLIGANTTWEYIERVYCETCDYPLASSTPSYGSLKVNQYVSGEGSSGSDEQYKVTTTPEFGYVPLPLESQKFAIYSAWNGDYKGRLFSAPRGNTNVIFFHNLTNIQNFDEEVINTSGATNVPFIWSASTHSFNGPNGFGLVRQEVSGFDRWLLTNATYDVENSIINVVPSPDPFIYPYGTCQTNWTDQNKMLFDIPVCFFATNWSEVDGKLFADYSAGNTIYATNGLISLGDVTLSGAGSDLTVGGVIYGNGSGLTNLVIPESAVNTNWVYYPMTDGQTGDGAHFTLTGLATAAGGWFRNANNLLAARLPGTANKAVFWNIPQSQMMAGTNVTLEAQFCTSNSFPFSVAARIVTLDFDTHTVDQGMLGGGITNVTPEGTNFWWFKTNFTIQSTNCLGTLVVGNRTEHTNVAYLTMVRMKITP